MLAESHARLGRAAQINEHWDSRCPVRAWRVYAWYTPGRQVGCIFFFIARLLKMDRSTWVRAGGRMAPRAQRRWVRSALTRQPNFQKEKNGRFSQFCRWPFFRCSAWKPQPDCRPGALCQVYQFHTVLPLYDRLLSPPPFQYLLCVYKVGRRRSLPPRWRGAGAAWPRRCRAGLHVGDELGLRAHLPQQQVLEQNAKLLLMMPRVFTQGGKQKVTRTGQWFRDNYGCRHLSGTCGEVPILLIRSSERRGCEDWEAGGWNAASHPLLRSGEIIFAIIVMVQNPPCEFRPESSANAARPP